MRKMLYYLTRGLIWLLSLLPLGVLYVISDGLYQLVFRVVGYRRKVVRKNLTDSFPEKSEQEIIKIEKDFYHWFCDYIVETIKLMTMSRKEMDRRCVFKNPEVLDRCVEEGQSCGIYLGHYCNWEWVSSLPRVFTKNAVCCQIYHALENKDFDELFKYIRGRFDAVSIPMAESLRVIMKYQQQGQPVIIGYISDQVPFWNNIHYWSDFLNHDTPVLTGTEKILRRLNHAVFYLDMSRPRRGYYVGEFKLITREPKQMEEFAITECYTRMLEKTIQRAPAYWLWTHNRWKRTREEWLRDHVDENGRVRA